MRLMANGKEAELLEVGYFDPELHPTAALGTGEVGYVATGLKIVQDVQVGDTVTLASKPASEQPRLSTRETDGLRWAVSGRQRGVPDAPGCPRTLAVERWVADLGTGIVGCARFRFRCGFLGLLHMEIIQERLEREYGIQLLATAPSVEYEVQLRGGAELRIDNPLICRLRARSRRFAPWLDISIIAPARYIGAVMELVTGRRGDYRELIYLDSDRVQMKFEMPLAELIVDFYDQLKSRTQGYASLDYVFKDMRASDLVKLDVLVNGQPVDALSLISHRDDAYPAAGNWSKTCAGLSPARCSTYQFKRRSAAASSLARRSAPCGKTSCRSAMAAM